MTRRAGRWWHAVAVGLAVGAFSHLGDELPGGWGAVANVGGPWVAAAFWAGSRAGSGRRGVVRGLVTLVVALGGYYVTKRILDPGPIAADLLGRDGLRWLVLAAVVGPVFGWLGGTWATRSGWAQVAAAAALGGALVGEGLRVPGLFFAGPPTIVLAVVEVAAGLAAAWTLSPPPRRPTTVGLAFAIGLIVFLTAGWVLGALSSVLAR